MSDECVSSFQNDWLYIKQKIKDIEYFLHIKILPVLQK